MARVKHYDSVYRPNGCIFVKRAWTRDKATILATFSRILENRVPIWLISFVEGTRFTPDKLIRSQQWAAEKGVFQPHHVLTPKVKGFVASIEGLRPHLDAVYDVTIGYVEGAPNAAAAASAASAAALTSATSAALLFVMCGCQATPDVTVELPT